MNAVTPPFANEGGLTSGVPGLRPVVVDEILQQELIGGTVKTDSRFASDSRNNAAAHSIREGAHTCCLGVWIVHTGLFVKNPIGHRREGREHYK